MPLLNVVPAWCAMAHGERDPYPAADRWVEVAGAFRNNPWRWLWIPARAEPVIGPAGGWTRWLGRTTDESSALDERLLDDEMAGLAVAAFGKAARFEHLAQLLEHAGAAAHHDAIGIDIERRLTDVVEQLFRGDQIGDQAAVAARLASDGRIIHEFLGQQRPEQLVVPQPRHQLFAIGQF